jgi:hypothetical protein
MAAATESPAHSGLTREQVEVFADGLYAVATLGGVHDNEVGLVREFLRDAGHPDYEAQLGSRAFDADHAATLLDTSFLRRLFVKASILMVRADHVVSDEEREMLTYLARAFGVSADLAELEQEVAGQSLE